jgi:RsiW-degrading membrane proteinase PrsW (M82 family)
MITHSGYDRVLMGSPLRRGGVSKAIAATLLVILAFTTLVHLVVFTSMPPGLFTVFLRALALSSLLALVPLSILWFLDRRERESPWLFAAAFLWGGLIATALALPFNTAFLSLVDRWLAHHPMLEVILGPNASLMIVAPISAPIVEELAKALGVVLLFWLLRPEFDNMRDGLVYGALVGLGFNWFEAALYVVKMYAKFGIPMFGLQLGLRYALFGLGGHALFTGLFGASLGLALQTQRKWLRILAPICGLLLAITAHMLNNALPLFATLARVASGKLPSESEQIPDVGFLQGFLTGSVTQLTIFFPFLLIMALAVWRSGVWERRVIREELAGESGETVTPEEYRAIVNDRVLHTRRIDRTNPRTSAALVNAQNELAFRKRRLKDEGGDPESDELVVGWRMDIRHLRSWI